MPSLSHRVTRPLSKALGKADLDGTDGPVLDIMEKFVKAPPKPPTDPDEIGLFLLGSVKEIMDALEESESEWAATQLKILSKKSPLALAVTFESLRRGAQLTFREAMEQELDISLNFLKTQDFYEGIRAQLIDKDRNPKWSHEHAGKVTKTQIERLFKMTAKPRLEFLN